MSREIRGLMQSEKCLKHFSHIKAIEGVSLLTDITYFSRFHISHTKLQSF